MSVGRRHLLRVQLAGERPTEKRAGSQAGPTVLLARALGRLIIGPLAASPMIGFRARSRMIMSARKQLVGEMERRVGNSIGSLVRTRRAHAHAAPRS